MVRIGCGSRCVDGAKEVAGLGPDGARSAGVGVDHLRGCVNVDEVVAVEDAAHGSFAAGAVGDDGDHGSLTL